MFGEDLYICIVIQVKYIVFKNIMMAEPFYIMSMSLGATTILHGYFKLTKSSIYDYD